MPNKYHSKMKSHGGGSNKAMGSAPSTAMPVKTANWPDLPGPAGSSRAAGTSTTGCKGKPFQLKAKGL